MKFFASINLKVSGDFCYEENEDYLYCGTEY